MTKKLRYAILFLALLSQAACKKGFLDAKPDKALLVPTTTADFWALLDNTQVFNLSPALTAIADGDFYTTDAGWSAYLTDAERNSYRWAPQIFGSEVPADWNQPYQQVFYANVVMDGLARLPSATDTTQEARSIQGTALFSRAWAYQQLTQEFTPPYLPATAGTTTGLPLRLTADVNARPPRATVADTYARILSDAKAAARLLPLQTGYKSRPSKSAAYALLARTYLMMGAYAQAALYADSALALTPALLNYNTLSTSASRPFPKALPNGNEEVIYYSAQLSYSFSSTSFTTLADTALYRSYGANDLRKVLFFRATAGGYRFNGNYSGVISVFAGLATDELYLSRAECRARAGQTAAALEDLNTLLRLRWKTGTFVPLSAANAETALHLVLSERRKELIGRNLRWADLRRLNPDPRFAMPLTRKVKDNSFLLAPNSPNYTYPIPAEEVSLSGLTQNPRE